MESHTAASGGPPSDLPAQEWITWDELSERDAAYRKAHRERMIPQYNEMRGIYSPTMDRWFWPPHNGKIWLNAPRGTVSCSVLVVDDVVLTADDVRELLELVRANRAARSAADPPGGATAQ